ncbi:MAG: TIGR02556 family CRISPR-associated protein [Candidatus Lokiarchaeota archaeon]|nr:TIGR02556 family CRISPR-associated protein [Candidatus Lokiarchaeota archaeon]
MINTIAEFGQFIRKEKQLDFLDMMLDETYELIEDRKSGHKIPIYRFIISIVLKKTDNNKWEYNGLSYKENDPKYKKKLLYLYRKGSGPDFTPTTKFTDIEKTIKKRIIGWFNGKIADENSKFLRSVYKTLKDSENIIQNDFMMLLQHLNDNKNFVTLQFLINNEEKYIGEIEEFKSMIYKVIKNKYRYKHNTYSSSNNKLCSVCNKEKHEVYGFYDDYSHSSDKPGMVAGGFNIKNSWKNYPICFDCIKDLEAANKLIKSYLLFDFYSIKYYLIPKFYESIPYELKINLINWIIDLREKVKFKKSEMTRLTKDENEILEELSKSNESFSLNFIFFQKDEKTKAFEILLDLKEVLPSRLNLLFKEKKYVDNIIFFKQARSKLDKPLCYFNFGVLRNFFPKSSIEGNNDKYFLEITEKIFKGRLIDLQFIIQNIMKKIRIRFSRNETTWLDTLKGFMLLAYLYKLNLIKKQKEVELNNQFFEEFKIQKNKELESKVNLFFDSFKSYFTPDAHKAIFLIGVLTQFLLNIQKNERDTSPFRSKLKGLKMSAYDISVLLPKIINKLEEYNKNYYKTLEELASKYLLSSGDYNDWRLPIDEMNLTFVLGMNLSKYFKIISENKKEEYDD